jgi:hypothetical protein
MPLSREARTRLAAQQAALVSALLAGGERPAGFDAESLRVAADSLARKRSRAVARAWPGLTRTLGPDFDKHFAAYAEGSALPRAGGPLADGRAFARWLKARRELPDAGRLQALAVDLHFITTAHGLEPRTGPAMKVAVLNRPRRLVMALRLPWFGERWWEIPFGNRNHLG